MLNCPESPLALQSTDGPDATVISGTILVWENDVSIDGFWMQAIDLGITSSPVVVEHCRFTDSSDQPAVEVWGSGVASIRACEFSNNSGSGDGGAIRVGPSADGLTVQQCSFLENSAVRGGPIYSEIPVTITACSFLGNSADLGGALYLAAAGSLVDTTIVGNQATFGGGIFQTQGFTVLAIVNCTLVDNTAALGGGVATEHLTLLEVWNSILHGNQPDQIIADSLAVVQVAYSAVQGGWPGVGNVDADPMLVDPGAGDFRLLPGSPCIDAGHNWAVPQDMFDLDDDGDTQDLLPFDLDGLPRFNADEQDFDPGCGVPVVVDMGAYEYQFEPVDMVLLGDIIGDGSIDVQDLVEVVLVWGPCNGEECCLSHLDLDGVVGVTDLVEVILRWG